MTDEEFDEHVAATELTEDGRLGGLDYCLLKLSAEAGEVAGLRGKEILLQTPTTNSPARLASYALELGDVLWYLHEACRLLGLTVDQVKRLNVMKLQRRRKLDSYGKPLGKEPLAEQHIAVMVLGTEQAIPTAATKPIECMAEHSYAEGCPLVCGTPTKCGRDGCSRALHQLLDAPKVRIRDRESHDEFQPCDYCEEWTRHRAASHGAYTQPTSVVCRARQCRALHERMLQRASCE